MVRAKCKRQEIEIKFIDTVPEIYSGVYIVWNRYFSCSLLFLFYKYYSVVQNLILGNSRPFMTTCRLRTLRRGTRKGSAKLGSMAVLPSLSASVTLVVP